MVPTTPNDAAISWLGFFVEDSPDGVRIVYTMWDTPAREITESSGVSVIQQVNGTTVNTVAEYYAALAVPSGTGISIIIRQPATGIAETHFLHTVAPPPEVSLYRRGILLATEGQLEHALSAFSEAIELLETQEPSYGDLAVYQMAGLWEQVGDVYARQEVTSEALDSYRKALSLADSAQQFLDNFTVTPSSPIIIRARIWKKLGTMYRNQSEDEKAWQSYEQAQEALTSYGRYDEAIALSLEAKTSLDLPAWQMAQIELTLGWNYYRMNQVEPSTQHFQESANLAQACNDRTLEGDAYVGLAVVAYSAGKRALFQENLQHVMFDAGSDGGLGQHKIMREIALYEILKLIPSEYIEMSSQGLGAVELYRFIEEDVDGDGIGELLVAGGITDFAEGPGVCLLFDWQTGGLRYHVLVPMEWGFQNLEVSDVNQDGRPEVLVQRREGSGAYLSPYIFAYDGQTVQLLFDSSSTTPPGSYHQGLMDFKDLDADGTDELLIWESAWDGDGQWDACTYGVRVFRWNGQRYVMDRVFESGAKYNPSLVTGRSVTAFGMPPDMERNIQIEDSRTKLKRLQDTSMINVGFVEELIARSYSFTSEGLYPEGEEMSALALEAAWSLPQENGSDFYYALALGVRGVNLQEQGDYLAADQDFRMALNIIEGLPTGSEIDDHRIRESLTSIYAYAAANLSNFDLQGSLLFFTRADRIANELGDPEMESMASANLGIAYLFLRDLEQARDLFSKALAADQELDRPAGRMRNLAGLGNVYLASGDVEKASEYFRMALDVALEIGDINHAADYYREIGYCYYELEQYDQALQR